MADFGSLYPQMPKEFEENFARNAPYLKFGVQNYNTDLGDQEGAFRGWLNQNNVPFNPGAPASDYDMRGFYKALVAGDPRATSAIDPNDNRMHYPDVWKTPYHDTFSNQSQWAGPVAPQWTPDDKLVSPGGRILFDDRNQPDRNNIVDIIRRRMGK